MTDILMPALSPTMEEGTLAKWLVKKGDTVAAGDVIAEIETDKATMEVEAVDEGVVEEILVEAGTEGVKVNAPIARLSGGTETKAPEPQPTEKAEPEAPAKTEAKSEPEQAKAAPAKAQSKTEGGERIFASPLARRIAEQKGLDLAAITGSGPHGRIIERDVKDAKPGAKPAATAAAAPTERRGETRPVQSLQQMGIPEGSYDLIPLDGMRKTVARRMTDSFRDVPHFPLTIDLQIDRLLEARGRINKMLEKDGVKVSVNDIILKACAVALKRVPEANASYSPEGIALHHHADIAMAVAVEGGLITPIIRKCETKGLAQIAQETKDLAERARTRKLKPEEFQGGTFSVSNLGMFGIKSFGSIINEPQGAILSVGAGTKQPVVRGDQLAIATVMSVTMTCDHRVVDGATGARWLEAFKALIEEPLAMMV
ncbi:pyruvate dehydrogenase complex dihydrolipoamide acetyltransferase [Phenylobacterium sp.]|uniref:pyruvate dehydrogenase complex dihydrolipoamide acetyltransferase n=1 Tax=Phenylobacterium sp. TaxID=1871053 RepID=UPI00262735F7|nr:pyruvate dehydrogenase complex dihydrolipoamide acetyltransferase [Phenylobacterium sp.]